MLPAHSLAGLAVMAVSEVAMLLQIEPFWSWHTPIAWTGYILFVDGWVSKRAGHSWLTTNRSEFAFLAAVSIPLWLVFEFYNLFIENWHYINLPEPAALRYLGYAWSFATIWPAIFETGDLVATFRLNRGLPAGGRSVGWVARGHTILVAAGLVMLVWPLVWPSPYLAAPVWLGFILLLDPINARAGRESLIGDALAGRFNRLVNLCVAGVVCGLTWEFWNYWARAKWIYTVPILPDLKVFEMPVPGYLGFPAFALECFTMYVAVRALAWRAATRPISL
jgi:hypothetical protein